MKNYLIAFKGKRLDVTIQANCFETDNDKKYVRFYRDSVEVACITLREILFIIQQDESEVEDNDKN